MYQAAFYDRSTYTYHVRDDKKGWIDFKYTPELYKITPNGPLETLDGKRATPVTKYEWRDTSLYEQDVDKITRVLIDVYKDSDDTPEYQNIVYLDIECEIGGTLTPEYIKSARQNYRLPAPRAMKAIIMHTKILIQKRSMVD
jgi:hypothetical protein